MMTQNVSDEQLPLPVDAAIPALEAFASRGFEPTLEEAGLSCRAVRAELLVHKPGLRAVFRITLDGVPAALKTYSEDPEPLARLLRRFEVEGLASGRPPTVTTLLGYHHDLRFIVIAWLHGPSADELIKQGNPERAAGLTAQWLRLTERLAIGDGKPLGPEMLLQTSETWISDLEVADARLGVETSACVRSLARRLPPRGTVGIRHANLIPRHVIDMGGGPGVIDWDAFRQGTLELDAGYFLASLSRLQTHQKVASQAGRAADAFQRELAPLVDAQALRWYRVAFVLEHAANLVRGRKAGWLVRAQAMLAEARDLAEVP